MNKFLIIFFLFNSLTFIDSVFEDEEFDEYRNAHVILLPNYGHLRGGEGRTAWTNQTYYGFLGIPYAKSPSGDLRFKAPVPKSRWNGIRDATKFGQICPSKEIIDSITSEEPKHDLEDCLNLCIYTKNLNKKTPVMFFVHGGALKKGAAAKFPPNYLLEEDVVLVVVQYRLGALGFASTRSKDIPGNMGILDVILALKWTQDNIKHFGGDPDQVTVFGQSAGAFIATVLAVTPKIEKKLFHRIIIQSGSLLTGRYSYNDPINDAQRLCMKFNCENCTEIEDINKCLKKAPLDKLVNANLDRSIPFGLTTFDFENVMPKPPRQMVLEANHTYEIMAGVNKNSGTYLLNTKGLNGNPRKYLDNTIKEHSEPDLSGSLLNLFSQYYLSEIDIDAQELNPEHFLPIIVDVISTITIKSPVQQFMELLLRRNNNNSTANYYLYTFDYSGEYIYVSYVQSLQESYLFYPFINGTHHADEVLYLFPWKNTLNADDTEMAKTMTNLWTSFAIHGTPKSQQQIDIPKMESLNGPYFHINKVIRVGNNFLKEFQATKRAAEGYIAV